MKKIIFIVLITIIVTSCNKENDSEITYSTATIFYNQSSRTANITEKEVIKKLEDIFLNEELEYVTNEETFKYPFILIMLSDGDKKIEFCVDSNNNIKYENGEIKKANGNAYEQLTEIWEKYQNHK